MYKIRVYTSPEDKKFIGEIQQNAGETVAQALARHSIAVDYPCGGRGSCGKCIFVLRSGKTQLTPEEKSCLTREQLEAGCRLLCRASFLTDGEIVLQGEREAPIISSEVQGLQGKEGEVSPTKVPLSDGGRKEPCYSVAADIGTTTLAFALTDGESGRCIAAVTCNNSQRQFGADVLSRITAANQGAAEQLKELIWQDIVKGIDALFDRIGESGSIARLVLSANTTMEHLLLGESCAGLGSAPFRPVSLELRHFAAKELYPKLPGRYREAEVTVLPGISAFVGADIVSGLYRCGLDRTEEPKLFLDIGTNGEMVLLTKKGMLATAAAAGPALEGGNISCGVAGVAGAIYSVSALPNRLITRTIENRPPIGLCGTGVLELACEMRKTGAMDEAGTFQEKYRREGFPVTEGDKKIRFMQEDMRQLQMAKAAIRTGIELLLKEMSVSADEITEVLLAGGLGYRLNPHKAAAIGLIPRALKNRTRAVGNTSLSGAIKYLSDADAEEKMKRIAAAGREMNLAEHPGFEQAYYAYMDFK